MSIIDPDWHELPEYVIEFGADGHSLKLIARSVLSARVLNNGAINFDAEFSAQTPSGTATANTSFVDYGGITQVLTALRSLKSGGADRIKVVRTGTVDVSIETRRERPRPRYWIAGRICSPDAKEGQPYWSIEFDFEWTTMDCPRPLEQAIAQLESLCDIVREKGHDV